MKLLLIEDDPVTTNVMTDILDGDFCQLDIAENGVEGLAKINNQQYDLILLDIDMPKLNGLDFLKYFRAQDAHTPVIITSATHDINATLDSFELGADDFIKKPFHLLELKARIKYQIGKRLAADTVDEESLCQGKFKLNRLKRQVSFAETSIPVTNTEFQIVTELMDHLGQLVTRDYLSMQVLNKPLSPYDRSIDVHVSNLRKKVQSLTGVNCFKTVRGQGYILTLA